MIPQSFPDWKSLPFHVQLGRNVLGLLSWHGMRVSPDWQNVRVEATVRNRQRIHLFEMARRKRIQVYLNKQSKRERRGQQALGYVGSRVAS